MEYQDTLDWLYGLEVMGIKLGLSNITELLSRLGDPQEEFRSVHVAGTNGKGSVCAMISSVLRAQGHSTGLYTSPHMVDFRERVQLDGTPISKKQLCRLVLEVRGHVEDMCLVRPEQCPTFFEVATALAFLHFAEMGAEMAVVEVGMGGRLDATNVVTPECTVITRIGLEHTQYLGESLGMIATEKAGIIKEGVPVVTAEEGSEALKVIRSRASELHAPLKLVREGVDFRLVSSDLEGTKVRLCHMGSEVNLPLLGTYQASNAATAYAVVEALRHRGMAVSDESVRTGLGMVRWPGRLELVRRSPNLIFDATHTPQGAETVAQDLRRLVPGRIILVMGVLHDKDLQGVVEPFARIAVKGFATAPLTQRAFSAEQVRLALSKHLSDVETRPSVVEGVCAALKMARPEDTVLVTGSIYTVGEAKAWWNANEGCQ
jgi:dihydrofolate synthase/folylpolyglutamate synthase